MADKLKQTSYTSTRTWLETPGFTNGFSVSGPQTIDIEPYLNGDRFHLGIAYLTSDNLRQIADHIDSKKETS